MGKSNRTCEYCGDTFRGIGGLHAHQSAIHDTETAVAVICTWCGDDMDVREWDLDGRHYCSRECSKAWTHYMGQGRRHPNYKGGSTSRSGEYDLTRMAVRHRDGECQRCGAPRCKSGRRLHVHHLIPEGQLDEPHEFTNLIAVCDRCHRTLEQMPKDQQLAECRIESVDTLELSGEIREWYEATHEKMFEPIRAPDPCLQMFGEAQRVLDERETKSS